MSTASPTRDQGSSSHWGALPRHVRLAENGKLLALDGDHLGALMHYREAMRLAGADGSAEVVSRHYMECSLESLELMGAYDDVAEYCRRAIEHYREHPPSSRLAQLDLASIHQRRGVVQLKMGDEPGALQELERASLLGAEANVELPLAKTLMRWVRARMHLTVERIDAEQRRHHNFSVRPETVRPSLAIALSGPQPPMTRNQHAG